MPLATIGCSISLLARIHPLDQMDTLSEIAFSTAAEPFIASSFVELLRNAGCGFVLQPNLAWIARA